MNLETAVKRYFKAKGLPLQPALTFSDIVIKDSFSTIDSRSDIRNLRTKLAGNLFLNIPLVSANMDTVTDAKMAIALARLGGLGFIHQFLPLEERVKEVQKVKDLPLAKVLVAIELYDQVGAKVNVEVGMADMHYNELKRACGK